MGGGAGATLVRRGRLTLTAVLRLLLIVRLQTACIFYLNHGENVENGTKKVTQRLLVVLRELERVMLHNKKGPRLFKVGLARERGRGDCRIYPRECSCRTSPLAYWDPMVSST